MTEFGGYSPEVKPNVTNYNNSAELLRDPIKYGEPGYDKVYIMARGISYDPTDRKWRVSIDSTDPTVTLNSEWRQKLGLENISKLVGDLRDGDGERLLVSSGAWIWMEDDTGSFLALSKRDKGAPTDALHWTGPAGRCGERPSRTSLDETNQELILTKSGEEEKIKLIGFFRTEKEKRDVIQFKLDQAREVANGLMLKYEDSGEEEYKEKAEYLREHIVGEDDIELVNIDSCKTDKGKLQEIVIEIDGEEIDSLLGFAFMDEKNNTLEIREELRYKLPEGHHIARVIDGEIFWDKEGKVVVRDTMMVDRADISGFMFFHAMVPALKYYLNHVLNGELESELEEERVSATETVFE
jgi:hypothetical protein